MEDVAMSQARWLTCNDVEYMLLQLRRRKQDAWKWTTRKARLFSCACCRRVWALLRFPSNHKGIELSEEVAEKTTRLRNLRAAQLKAQPIILGIDQFDRDHWRSFNNGTWGFYVDINPQNEMLSNPCAKASTPTAWGDPYGTANDVRALVHFQLSADAASKENLAQSDLVRDIVGVNKVFPAIAPAWLAWNDGTIVKLAQTIYDERELPSGHLDTGRLAILADALEDAGCTNADILAHCRSAGPHVRGCWVVDLLLAKE